MFMSFPLIHFLFVSKEDSVCDGHKYPRTVHSMVPSTAAGLNYKNKKEILNISTDFPKKSRIKSREILAHTGAQQSTPTAALGLFCASPNVKWKEELA